LGSWCEALCLKHAAWHVGQGQRPFIEVVPREHPHGQRTKGGRPRRIYVSDSLERFYTNYLWLLSDAADGAGAGHPERLVRAGQIVVGELPGSPPAFLGGRSEPVVGGAG
jgi:hypothetical protein